MVKKRTRKELYDKFRQGAIPSGADFADLIRSHLNLLEDGIDVSDDSDDPVSFRARGEEENLLDFSDPEGKRRWRISGRPEDLSEEGLHIKTSDDKSRLYIERELGKIGVGTDIPSAKLHIKQINSEDAFRVDDDAEDKTPFIITSEGNVGIGIGQGNDRPAAKLHVNHNGTGDALRVDDQSQDDTPFVISEEGKVGIRHEDPVAELTVKGGVYIGDGNDAHPGHNNLYVEGDIKVGGTVVLGSGPEGGGIEINGPLQSKLSEIVLKDNIKIIGDPDQKKPGSDEKSGDSLGNLSVQGDTTLGSTTDNTLSVNGSIVSGGDGSNPQNELVINNNLKVNRDTNDPTVTVENDIEVKGRLIGGLPIGTILMYDGTDWEDNVTLPGWYACTGANGTPNLRDLFILGWDGSAGSIKDTGGAHSYSLTEAQMPSHTHSFSPNQTTLNGSTGNGGEHYHQYSIGRKGRSNGNCGRAKDCDTHNTYNNHYSKHSHSFSLTFTPSGTIQSSGSNAAVDNRPKFYRVIYIRRCE